MSKLQQIQTILGVTTDGIFGPKSRAALEKLIAGDFGEIHRVKASSFADPADVAAFERCKAKGKSDAECFKFGDNGIGKWGHNTAQEREPMAALPREDWQEANKKGGDKLIVEYRGVDVEGILGDTMPARANIKNGAGIDLNPAFAKALGLTPPFLVDGVTWRWA